MKKVWKILVVTIMVMSLCACGQTESGTQETETQGDGGNTAESSTVENAGGEESKQVVYIPKNTGDFWSYVEAGVTDAATEQGIEVSVRYPDKNLDAASEISLLEDVINTEPDAIVISPVDMDALVEPVERAMNQGIPVILIDTTVASDNYVCAYLTDNYAAGELAAEQMHELLGGEGGKVAVFNTSPSSNSGVARAQGFIDKCESQYPEITCMEQLYGEGDSTKTSTQALDTITANPDIKAFYCIDDLTTIAAANALLQADRTDVILGGFDSNSDEIALMNDGVIQFLVVQQPYQMGYMGMNAACDTLKGNQPAHDDYDTGSFLINQENKDSEEAQKVLNPLG